MLDESCRKTTFVACKSWIAWPCIVVLLLGAGLRSVEAQKEPRTRCENISYQRVHGVGGPGPYDYTDRSTRSVDLQRIVTKAHLKPQHLRGAIAGTPSMVPYQNLQYTLRAIPNHHEALFAMGLYQYKVRKYHPKFFQQRLRKHERYRDMACWFERALRLAPHDVGIYNAHGRYLHMTGQRKAALEAFQKVTELVPDSAQGHYNVGLAYYSLGQYAQAAQSARRAEELGHTRRELQTRLKRKGHWSAKKHGE